MVDFPRFLVQKPTIQMFQITSMQKRSYVTDQAV